MSVLRKLLRMIVWLVAIPLMLVSLTLAVAVLALHTEWGRSRLVAFVVPKINAQLDGKLAIGGVEGDLLHTLVLRDVEVRDADGQPAARVHRVTVDYDLMALLHHSITLSSVSLDDAWVRSAPLRDGRNNLASLPKPSTTPPSPPSQNPWWVRVQRVELVGRGVLATAEGTQLDARAHAIVRAAIHGDDVRIEAQTLDVITSVPALAGVSATGVVRPGSGAVTTRFENVNLQAQTTGLELARVVPATHVRGPLHLEARVDGGLDSAMIHASLRPLHGEVTADAQVGLTPALVWKGAVAIRDLDPALWQGVPHGNVLADVEGHGQGAHGDVVLHRLDASASGATVEAHGRGTLDGEVDATAHIAASDLARLRAIPGAAGLAGRLEADAHVVRHVSGALAGDVKLDGRGLARLDVHAGALHVDAHLTRSHAGTLAGDVKLVGHDLSRAAVKLGGVALSAHVNGYSGHGTLTMQKLVAGGQRVDEAGLTATADGHRVQLALTGHAHHAEAGLYADGTFELAGGKLRRIAGTVSNVHLRSRVGHIEQDAKAEVLLDLQRFAVTVHHFHLDGSAQAMSKAHLLVDGSYASDTGVDAHLETKNLRLDVLANLLAPERAGALPDINLSDLVVDARGDPDRPDVHGKLTVEIGHLAPGFDKVTLEARGQWLHGLAEVTASMRAGHGEQADLTASVPLPLSPRQGLAARLTFDKLAPARFVKLVPQLDGLEGVLSGELDLDGTLEAPHVHLAAAARNVARDELKNIDGFLTVEFRHPELKTTFTASLQKKEVLKLEVAARAAAPTFDALLTQVKAGQRPAATVDGRLQLESLELKRLRGISSDTDRLDGVLTGSVTATGELLRPLVVANLAMSGVSVDAGDSDAVVNPEKTEKKKKPAATTPTVQKLAFRTAHVFGRWDWQNLDASVDLDESNGGRLTAKAHVPADATLPLTAALDAQRFDLRLVGPFVSTVVAELKGTLAAHVDVKGLRSAPAANGYVHLASGAFLLRATAQRYKDVAVSLGITPTLVTLEHLRAATSDGGKVAVTGKLTLKDFAPQKLEAAIDANRFSVGTGGQLYGSLDGHIGVEGHPTPIGFGGTVNIKSGTVHLPAFAGHKELASTGPLEDVLFVDKRAQKEAADKAGGLNLDLAVKLTGPFRLHGPEISTEMRGQLEVRLRGPDVAIDGDLSTDSGWIDVLGHRFTIDKVRVGFGGGMPIDPTLDIRVTRQRSDVVLAIDVSGTAARPRVTFSCDPPIYSDSEILALIISDDPGNQPSGDQSLNSKVVGALSGVIVGKLKDQIAPQLPVDVLKVDVGGQGGTSTRVEVGKYITPSLYLSYVHQFGQTLGLQPINSNQGTVEWHFARKWELDTTYGDASVGAADVVWRIRF